MKIFSHINELGKEGWESLRTLVLACPKVAIWSPSASYLESFRKINPLLPTKEELLWYIREGYIQYRARKWWIFNEERRKEHGWEFARWVEPFDEEILQIWKDDQHNGVTGAFARVVAVDEEVGLNWAREQIYGKNIDLKTLVKKIQKNTLLVGYREKALRFSNIEEMAISILRDARNHADVFGNSGADRNLGMPADRYLVNVFVNAVKDLKYIPKYSIRKPPQPRILIEMINYVLNILGKSGKSVRSQDEAFERTRILLHSPRNIELFRDWVATVDSLAQTVDKEILREELIDNLIKSIDQGVIKKGFLDYLNLKGEMQTLVFMSNILINVYGLYTGSNLAPLGLVLFSIPQIMGLLQWLGWISDNYYSINWPFYIAEGKQNVGRIRREIVLLELAKYAGNTT